MVPQNSVHLVRSKLIGKMNNECLIVVSVLVHFIVAFYIITRWPHIVTADPVMYLQWQFFLRPVPPSASLEGGTTNL